MLTQGRLKELLSYNPATGLFVWLVDRKGVKAGDAAGGICPSTKYIGFQIDRKRYLAHRLAWLYQTGSFPAAIIDHIDRDRANNKWANLREATYAQNNINSPARPNNLLGVKGVHRRKVGSRRFCAQIKISGIVQQLGLYDTIEEASAAYTSAARQHFGDFASG